MARLASCWQGAWPGIETEEDVIEFIFERLDTSDFEDYYIDAGNGGEANELVKYSAESQREALYDFMIELLERANGNI